MRSIRLLVAAALVAGLLGLAIGPANGAVKAHHRAHRVQLLSGPEGGVVTNPSNPQFSNPYTYTATTIGGITGVGTWRVTITRGTKTITYTNAQGPNQSIGTIQPGDVVKIEALAAGTVVAVGNPCPASVPGAC